MKFARSCGIIFGMFGTLLMVGTILLCLIFLDAPVELIGKPTGALHCSEEMMQALAEGDYARVSEHLLGQPDLGADYTPEDPLDAMVWEAFADSLSYEFVGVCYAEDTGIYRDVSITSLDIPAMTADLQTRANALLEERMEYAVDLSEIYDDNNNFREDLIAQILEQALEQCLREEQYITREITLKLVCRDGSWWVVPDQPLLQCLAGGVA